MQYLLSEQLAATIAAHTAEISATVHDAGGEPQLAVVLVGNNEASLRYVALKTAAAKKVGITVSLYHVPETAPINEVEEALRFLASDEDTNGIIIQLPLPDGYAAEQVDSLISLIPSEKDVDGLRGDWQSITYTRATVPSFLAAQPKHLPPMVQAVCSLLDSYDIALADHAIALVGAGRLVGAPLAAFFTKLGLSFEVLTETTDHIIDRAHAASLLISGTGQEDLITYQWVSDGAVVVDCARDVHEDSVIQIASALAPRKGGVGPLTVAWLLHNVAQAASTQLHSHA